MLLIFTPRQIATMKTTSSTNVACRPPFGQTYPVGRSRGSVIERAVIRAPKRDGLSGSDSRNTHAELMCFGRGKVTRLAWQDGQGRLADAGQSAGRSVRADRPSHCQREIARVLQRVCPRVLAVRLRQAGGCQVRSDLHRLPTHAEGLVVQLGSAHGGAGEEDGGTQVLCSLDRFLAAFSLLRRAAAVFLRALFGLGVMATVRSRWAVFERGATTFLLVTR